MHTPCAQERSSSFLTTSVTVYLPFVLLFLCLITGCSKPQSISADLDNDGRTEIVSIVRGAVVVSRGSKLVWRQEHLRPWKLELPDVDGDGKREIAVGVYKKSPKDPVMAKRVFVYGWGKERMLPKWLGSRLSRRFDDFTFSDINRDGWSELFALERAPGGRHRVAAYRWRVFGFDWLGCSESKDFRSIAVKDGITVASTPNADLSVELSNGKVILHRR